MADSIRRSSPRPVRLPAEVTSSTESRTEHVDAPKRDDDGSGFQAGTTAPATTTTSARSGAPATAVRMQALQGDAPTIRSEFVGRVVEEDGKRFVEDMFTKGAPRVELPDAPAAGSVVKVRTDGAGSRVDGDPLATAGSARAQMYDIAARHGLDPTFPPAVRAEVAAWIKDPGIDDPALEDQTAIPYVTIDNADSRDLDQAMHIARRDDGGYRVSYALADASYYVKPGTALFDEAVKRGTSFYLPGLCVPMLPEEMSEGLVSLNEGVDRRAMVFHIDLDANGNVEGTAVKRAKVRSRAKLAYDGVQSFHDAHDAGKGATDGRHHGHDFTETLHLLQEVGELRMHRAAEHDVVRFRRTPVKVHTKGHDDATFELVGDARNDVEKWNEQISLLCNMEGAKLLQRDGDAPNLQAIFRQHDAPPVARVEKFERFVSDLVEGHGLDPATWGWSRGSDESLADYLARLPTTGEDGRAAKAIHRQAMLTNVGSEFSDEPGLHHGVGATEGYARFSSPMREMVGIFTHKEALELLDGKAHDAPGRDDVKLQQQIIGVGNGAKKIQSRITKDANKLAIDDLFGPDLARPVAQREVRTGTVMGLTKSKAYVQLDEPPSR